MLVLEKDHRLHISERNLKRKLSGLGLHRRRGYAPLEEVVNTIMHELVTNPPFPAGSQGRNIV